MDFTKCHNRWLALHVRSNHEFATAEILRNKGYEEYVPVHKAKQPHSKNHREISRPLFAGYIFCRYSDDVRWPIVTTQGVIGILKAAGEIATIDEETIKTIQKIQASDSDLLPTPYLVSGQRVRVTDGPLNGVEGKLLRIKGVNRLVLSVDMMQRSICTEIDINSVRSLQ